MTEMMRGCEGPETATEACAPCQTPAGNLECCVRATPDGTGLSADQEMQWISARGDSPLRAPSLNSQLFLSPPQGLGADPFRGPPLEPCEGLPGEPPNEMCRESGGLACEEMCGRGPSCKGSCWELSCEELHDDMNKGSSRCLYEDPYESGPESPAGRKNRLPSIVVEPIEVGDVESGELRWPPEDLSLLEEPEQDELFVEGEEVPGAGLSSFESDLEEVIL
ncbi:LBH domain-containing protein 1 isoform X2 [Paroedura picta]